MLRKSMLGCLALSCAMVLTVSLAAVAADLGLKEGTPDLKSAGPLAFGPEGVLLVGDPANAAVYAIDTGDTSGSPASVKLNVEGINQKIAALLGTTAADILINDLAVNPLSGNAYLSVSRGRGPDAAAVLLKVDGEGKISELSLKQVKFAKAALPNAPTTGNNRRQESITDLAYADGRVFIAGLSNEEFASNLRAIPFPFGDADKGTSVEIYHGAHGKFETASPVRTFVVYNINGDTNLLAAYTCTPLVKFPVSQLKPGEKLKGTTIAELGNRNRPLDMIVYSKGGKDYILMANSSRGMMKITTDNIDKIQGITERISSTAGLTYETIAGLEGVVQLDKLNDENALLLVQAASGALNLQTVALP
jgi:hypothetical protein